MAVDIKRIPDLQFADDDEDEMQDFPLRDGLSWYARRLAEKLLTIARGVMLISGEPGGGKDLFAISTSAIFKYCFNRPIILDFKPKRLFGNYRLLGVNEILELVEEVAKQYRVSGIESSADSKELAQFMQEAIVKWLLEGEGYKIFRGAIYVVSELKKVAFNRNPMSRTNKFIGTLNSVWRHLDLLEMGTHVYPNEIDVKAFLQYAKLRAYCSQTLRPNVFRAKIERGMYAGPDFVISNLRMKPLILYIDGKEPRDFLGGDCFYNLYKTKHMHF